MFLPRFKKDKSFPVKNYDFSAKIFFENENSCFSRFLQHCFYDLEKDFHSRFIAARIFSNDCPRRVSALP